MRVYRDSLFRCIWMTLLVVLLLFPALAIDPLGLNSPVGLTTPVSADDGEGWYMDGNPVLVKKDMGKTSDFYPSFDITIGNGSSTGYLTWHDSNSPDDCGGTYSGEIGWARPSTYLKPGDKYLPKLATKLTAHNSCGSLSMGCGVNIEMGRGGGWIECGSSAHPTSNPDESLTVPKGGSGDKLAIDVSCHQPGNTAAYCTYNYVYKASGTPPPATTPATPVSAGSGTGWSGTWNYPKWGNVTITQSGNQLTFVWAQGYGTITGTVSGNKFTGTAPDKLYQIAYWDLTLAPDGQLITGSMKLKDAPFNAAVITMTRVGAGTGTGTGTTTATTTGTGAALVAESRTAAPNSTVQVPIRLDKASNIGSMNFMLTYDPQVIKVNKVDSGSLLSGALFTPNYKTPPQVRFGLATSTGISGSGTVAYIEFQVIGAAGSSSPLTFSELSTTDTSGNSVAVTTQNGTVTVASAGGAGGKVKGDYNGDGRVTELDALAALKMSVKLLPEDLTLDMDGNGKVTAEDARLILKKALGK